MEIVYKNFRIRDARTTDAALLVHWWNDGAVMAHAGFPKGLCTTVEEVTKKLLSYECVKGIHDLRIHNYGVHNDFITVHVEIDSSMDMIKAHDLIDNIEKDFKKELGTDLTIHMDPIEMNNPTANKLYDLVKQSLITFDIELEMHDFRIVEGPTHTNILFDVIVPYEKNYTIENLTNHFNQTITPEKGTYYYVIQIDRPYI